MSFICTTNDVDESLDRHEIKLYEPLKHICSKQVDQKTVMKNFTSFHDKCALQFLKGKFWFLLRWIFLGDNVKLYSGKLWAVADCFCGLMIATSVNRPTFFYRIVHQHCSHVFEGNRMKQFLPSDLWPTISSLFWCFCYYKVYKHVYLRSILMHLNMALALAIQSTTVPESFWKSKQLRSFSTSHHFFGTIIRTSPRPKVAS